METCANEQHQRANASQLRQGCVAAESFTRDLAGSIPIAVRDVTGPAIGLIFLADPYLYSGDLERNAALGKRDYSVVHHTPRRTITSRIDWPRHISLVEIDSLGLGHRRRLRCCRRRTGCAHRYGHSPGSAAFEKLRLWLITLIVLRAGVVEELFYRGYAIERLQAVGRKPAWAAGIPLVIFALGHWTGGAANILIALVLGAILSAFYLWRRDLVANMIGHGTVDFIANVLPNLFS